MPGGGSKPGERRGGRKRGTPNKASAARQAEVAASGITPLEVMLDNMRVAHQRAGELLSELIADVKAGEVKDTMTVLEAFKAILALRKTAQDCAADAAKYVHPKLANISHANEPDHPLIVSDEERANAVLALLTQGGADLTT
jgi:hypothetical protein